MNATQPTLQSQVERRVLVLDGAMGTMIQQYGLTEDDFRGGRFGDVPGELRGNNDMLCLTRPDVVCDIHRKYLSAGADIIETNTFSAQRVSQADYHLEAFARDMALHGARLARRCADEFSSRDKPRYVAGSIGPTNKTLSISPDVCNAAARDLSFDQMTAAYYEQADALIEGGVDALLIETVFDSLNSKAAIVAALKAMEHRGVQLPVMLSVTVSDLAGRTLSGQTLDAFLATISTYPIFSIGLNCSFGAEQMLPYLRHLAATAPYYISCYPNAGLPNQMGLYDETPESMAEKMAPMVEEGLVNIIGGCCGTTDAFIRLFGPLVDGRHPHVPVPRHSELWLSGLEAVRLPSAHDGQPADRPFLVVGERCNVAGSRKFLRLIKEKQYDEALQIARRQVAQGAAVIDINMDDALLDAEQEMARFLNMLAAEPDICRVPVMIDSSRWPVIMRALGCVQGKSIVNSISLKEGEEVFVSHARDVRRMGAAVVVMCFDEQGQATTYARRTAIARRAYRLLTEQVGMSPQDIIFDPNILAIATGMAEHDSQALSFIQATEWIRTHLPLCHVSGGVSNLSFSFRGNNALREAMHTVFLYHARQHGMDIGIVNPGTNLSYDDIPEAQRSVIEDALLCRTPDAAERLTDMARNMMEAEPAATAVERKPAAAPQPGQRRRQPVEQRLQEALLNGSSEYLTDDLHEALGRFPRAVDIIEGPLMEGMNRVGQLFGQGKMFLPQVVKTARTMKQAVETLQPYIEKEKLEGQPSAGRVLLATVKGDVHDIGKNIVAVVMACNGYDIIDMGVMVPPEQIVRKAQQEHVDIIGLSGLITPSLEEMVRVAQLLREAGLSIPIMIGGATTSRLHVALRIAPVYDGPVVWMKDASQNPLVATRLMNDVSKHRFAEELNAEYEQLRHEYNEQQQQLLTLDEARRNKPHLFD